MLLGLESLRSTSTVVIKSLLDSQPTTSAKVLFAWQIAAGPALARAGTAEWSAADRTLRIAARDALWARELRHARTTIQTRLQHWLGSDVIERVVIENREPRTLNRNVEP